MTRHALSPRSPRTSNLDPRHTTNPPDSCLSCPFSISGQSRGGGSSTAPPGGQCWHGFAVRRPPVRRGGRGLTFGLLKVPEPQPMQTALPLDIGGMERKTTGPTFFTERPSPTS
jgi:hypothetical protein